MSVDAAVRLERTLPASPSEVFRAWLDPELLGQWMSPDGFTVARAEVDARVGGRLRIWHSADGKDSGGFECEILELVPDARLVFRWGFVGPERERGPVFDSRLTLTLRPAPGGCTRLTLRHERLEALAAAMPEAAAGVATGWGMALDKLERLDALRSARR